MKIAVVGAGNVGSSLGRRFAVEGHEVVFGVRDLSGERARSAVSRAPGSGAAGVAEAASGAEVVVLAVPLDGLDDALAAVDDLSGRVVVDAVNAVRGPVPGGLPSVSHHILALRPEARIVKAFNTIGYEVMLNPIYPGGRAVLPLAGVDPAGRATVAGLAAEIGFDPVDLGGLDAVPLVEAFARVWIRMAMTGRGRDFAFGLLAR